ncbi:MAG TPA: PAS domain S-box protein, partial [Blastocatellia bacterium]
EGRYIEVNESYLRLTGYTREEVIGRRSKDLNVWIDPEERARVVEMLKHNGRARNVEIRFRKKSGEEMVTLFSAELITLNGERCLLTATTDITERKKNEEDLRASEERFAIAFSATPDPVTISTLNEERYLDVNEAFLRITGYSRDELVGRMVSETGFWVNWQDRDLVTQALKKNRRVRNLEIKYRAKSGKACTALISAQIINLDGRECALAVYNDITEREKAAKIQSAVYRISEAANSAENLQALFRSIHEIVGELLPAQNFYIALYDPSSEEVSFPYFVDERDPPPAPRKFGKGLTEHVIRTGKPVHVVPDRLQNLVDKGEAELIGAHSSDWFGVPLKAQDKTIGALVLQSYNEDLRFDEEDKNILVFVSTQVAMAIERKRAEDQLRQRVEQLQTIYRLSDALSRAEAIEEIYEESLKAFERALKVSRSSVLLFDSDGVIRFKAWHGLSEEYREKVEGHSPWPKDEKNAHPIFVPDVAEAPDLTEFKAVIAGEGIRAMGFIPLVYQARLLGKFMLYYDEPHRFTAEEAQLAQTISSHVAFAIER